MIAIDVPLKGEWKFLRPPGHHPFAFDFVKMDESRKRYSELNKVLLLICNIPSDNYYCWDQPIYAPISGEVIQVGNGWEDHKKTNLWKTIRLWYNATYRFKPQEMNGRLDIRPNAGNYIMIQAKEGYVVFMAHMKNGSIKVQEGQSVQSGDLIGNVGNSGNTTAPHLHINLFDQMEDPYKAKVLPFVFREFEELDDAREWKKRELGVPRVKTFIRL